MDFKSLRNLTLIRKTLKIDILRLNVTIKMVVQKLSMKWTILENMQMRAAINTLIVIYQMQKQLMLSVSKITLLYFFF